MGSRGRWPTAADLGIEPGQRWAYRATSSPLTDQVTEVIVLKVGTKRPARVQVEFVDDADEGRRAWVPPVRLVVRWPAAAAWVERQQKWQRVVALSSHVAYSVEAFACSEVLGAVDPTIERVGFEPDSYPVGVLVVRDPSVLDGLDDHCISSLNGAFVDGGVLVAPWPAALSLAEHLASQHSERIVEWVRDMAQRRLTATELARCGDDRKYGSNLSVREYYNRLAQGEATALAWCGRAVVGERSEVDELRAAVVQLDDTVRRLFKTLQESVRRPITSRTLRSIARQLGISLDAIQWAEPYRYVQPSKDE
jgi:hypothetical protein